MISSKRFESVDGATTRFLSDFIIQSEQHCRVYVYKYNPSCSLDTSCNTMVGGVYVREVNAPQTNDLITLEKWDLVDNSIVFYTPPSVGVTVIIEVATTPEEFGNVVAMPIVALAQSYADNAAISASSALVSANSASSNASIATTGANTATTKAGEASASATSANLSKIAAETGASTATTQAGIATTQAGIATTGANTATTQAGISTTQAGIATTQAGIATTKASEANTSAINALASEGAAAASAASIDNATFVRKDSANGAAFLPAGTTAQRPVAPTNGYMRYNSDLLAMEAYVNGVWGSVGGGATGGGTDHVFNLNDYLVTTSFTIPAGKSAVVVGDSAGNLTMNAGTEITFANNNSRLVVL